LVCEQLHQQHVQVVFMFVTGKPQAPGKQIISPQSFHTCKDNSFELPMNVYFDASVNPSQPTAVLAPPSPVMANKTLKWFRKSHLQIL
jgi:hypothetical protein